MGSTEVKQETTRALSIGIMTFDLGWPWTVPDLRHRIIFISNISKTMRDIMLGMKYNEYKEFSHTVSVANMQSVQTFTALDS